MNKMTYIKDLTAGTRFTMGGAETIYLCTGVGTMGNLTRVSYIVPESDDTSEFTFTKVNLTTARLV